MNILLYIANLICIFLTAFIGILIFMGIIFAIYFVIEIYKEKKQKENTKK